MVTRKSPTGTSKKLKVKKETLKDLDVRRGVKGGGVTMQSLGGCRQIVGQDGTTTQPLSPVGNGGTRTGRA